jgi:signal transduction histidine kinase
MDDIGMVRANHFILDNMIISNRHDFTMRQGRSSRIIANHNTLLSSAQLQHSLSNLYRYLPVVFILAVLLFSTRMAFGQTKLATINAMPDDTIKFYALFDYGVELELDNPDSAIIVYNSARDVAERIHYPMGYCKYANAIAYPLELLERYNEKDSIIYRAIEVCKQNGFVRELAKKYHALGVSEQMRRQYQKSITFYLQGLTLVDQLKDTTLYTAFYNNLGGVFKGIGNNQKAYEYGEKALSIHRARGKKSGIASAQLNLSILDVRNQNYSQAIIRCNEALQISNELNDIEGMMISRINLADVYLGLRDGDQALAILQPCDSLAALYGSKRNQMLTQQAFASVFYFQKNYKKSIYHNEKALQLAMDMHEKERISTSHKIMADNYEAISDFNKAYFHYKLFHQYADSVKNEALQKNVELLEMQYNSEKQERQILEKNLELSEANNKSQTRGIWLIVVIGLLLLGLSLFFFNQRLNRQRLLAAAQQKDLEIIRMRENERERIAAEMHDDLGSGLTSIHLLTEIALKSANNSDKTQLTKIAEKVNVLVQKMSDIIWAMNPANDRLDVFSAYLRSYAANFLDDADIELHFNATNISHQPISGEMRQSILLVVKEILNNTVKYAHAKKVTFQMSLQQSTLSIALTDNGRGFDATNIRSGANGIQNIEKRMAKINARVERKSDNGTSYEMYIPLLI